MFIDFCSWVWRNFTDGLEKNRQKPPENWSWNFTKLCSWVWRPVTDGLEKTARNHQRTGLETCTDWALLDFLKMRCIKRFFRFFTNFCSWFWRQVTDGLEKTARNHQRIGLETCTDWALLDFLKMRKSTDDFENTARKICTHWVC